MGFMRFLLPNARQIFRSSSLSSSSSSSSSPSSSSSSSGHRHVPKGHVAIYVGEQMEKKKKRFVVPIEYLNHPLFREFLNKAEEEFGFHHSMGGLTIPCHEEAFLHLITSKLY